MVVDDIVCEGAEPLFVLDYLSCGKVVPERIADIVAGIAKGCEIAGAALLGGETAEHPGLMHDDEYDLATFAVGVVDQEKRLGAHLVKSGDAIIGLPSTGVHANGFSLVRKLILDHDLDLFAPYSSLDERTLGEALLEPCAIYSPAVLEAMRQGQLHAAAHITGGGLQANIDRVVPPTMRAVLDWDVWDRPPLFTYLGQVGEVSEHEMRRVFNLGIGMALIVPHDQTESIPSGIRIGTIE
jgi:phosphoribosylformylglycinamidine cyclo-ligase